MSLPDSPPDDVTFRPSDAPPPSFSGMTPILPSALRHLRRQDKNPLPSDMTALAKRLGGIRLDHSPNSDPPTPNHPPTEPSVQPTKLEFSEFEEQQSKENIIISPQLAVSDIHKFSDENNAPSIEEELIASTTPIFPRNVLGEVENVPLQIKTIKQSSEIDKAISLKQSCFKILQTKQESSCVSSNDLWQNATNPNTQENSPLSKLLSDDSENSKDVPADKKFTLHNSNLEGELQLLTGGLEEQGPSPKDNSGITEVHEIHSPSSDVNTNGKDPEPSSVDHPSLDRNPSSETILKSQTSPPNLNGSDNTSGSGLEVHNEVIVSSVSLVNGNLENHVDKFHESKEFAASSEPSQPLSGSPRGEHGAENHDRQESLPSDSQELTSDIDTSQDVANENDQAAQKKEMLESEKSPNESSSKSSTEVSVDVKRESGSNNKNSVAEEAIEDSKSNDIENSSDPADMMDTSVKEKVKPNGELEVSTHGTLPAEKLNSATPVTTQSVCDQNKAIDVARLKQEIVKIQEGNQKWPWPERCEALKFASTVVRSNLDDEEARHVLTESLPDLSTSLKRHLEEKRVSIVSSALSLFDSVVASPISSNALVKSIFPTVANIASGNSPAAHEAARSLATTLCAYPSLENMLEVNDIGRLYEVAKESTEKPQENEDISSQVQNLLKIVSNKHANLPLQRNIDDAITCPDTGTTTAKRGSPQMPPVSDKPIIKESSLNDLPACSVIKFAGSASNCPSPLTPSHRPSTPKNTNRNSVGIPSAISLPIPSSVERIRSLRLSRMSWRAKLETPLLLSKQGNEVNTSRCKEGVHPPNVNSVPTNQGRMYTQTEVGEIRQAAIETVIENLSKEHKEEREKLKQQIENNARLIQKERADSRELRSVLEEYELTMNKMVADLNSQANARTMALQVENKNLKKEVVDTRGTFEKLKDRYDELKKTNNVLASKEARYTEQINELNKNMIELQTWSNELKANTEKKLNKAFDNLTSYRTYYLEQEAHAKKALSDLAKTRAELEKESANHAETAKKLSLSEVEHNRELDIKAEQSAAVEGMKTNLLRMTSERDNAMSKLEEAQKELHDLRIKVGELEPTASRANDLKKQVDSMRVEKQQLKARAFDDITRIREVEDTLREKENEIEELSTICDEVMSQLEASKLNTQGS